MSVSPGFDSQAASRKTVEEQQWASPDINLGSTCTCKHKHAQTPPTQRHNHLHTQEKKKVFERLAVVIKLLIIIKKQTFHFLLRTVLLLSFYFEHRVVSVTVSRQAHQKGSMRVCISCSKDKCQPADIVANIFVQNRLSKKLSFGNHLFKL